jgi:hypothetical protein
MLLQAIAETSIKKVPFRDGSALDWIAKKMVLRSQRPQCIDRTSVYTMRLSGRFDDKIGPSQIRNAAARERRLESSHLEILYIGVRFIPMTNWIIGPLH